MEKTTVQKTYRFPASLSQELDEFRKEQDLPPKEITVVTTALREYIERKREASKRGSRR